MEILYKENTFDFDYLADVMRLSLVVLPERMRLITDVTWRCVYPDHPLNFLLKNGTNQHLGGSLEK